jgi:hypothetical protein
MATCVLTLNLAKDSVAYSSNQVLIGQAIAGPDGTYWNTTGYIVFPLANSPLNTAALNQGSYYWFNPPDDPPFLAQIPSSSTANYSDLVKVDPSSLSPVAVPPAAWTLDLATKTMTEVARAVDASNLSQAITPNVYNELSLMIAVPPTNGRPFIVEWGAPLTITASGNGFVGFGIEETTTGTAFENGLVGRGGAWSNSTFSAIQMFEGRRLFDASTSYRMFRMIGAVFQDSAMSGAVAPSGPFPFTRAAYMRAVLC